MLHGKLCNPLDAAAGTAEVGITMDDREKLVELLREAMHIVTCTDKAEYLISKGVVIPVRCKDCKWWNDHKCININGANCLVTNGDWFCCSGEAKYG